MPKIAVAFGSFDVLHPGHIHYLRSASRYGKLTVVVARDSSIRRLKGRNPLIDERSRLEIVRSLKFVDRAMLGNRVSGWNGIYPILRRIKPDFIVIGYDQHIDMAYLGRFLKENGLRSRVVRLKPFRHQRYKSSKLKELLGL